MTTVPTTELSKTMVDIHDIVIVDQDNLDEFDEIVGGIETIDSTILTEDDHTRGRVEFNLITCVDSEYGIATQLSDPTAAGDNILDLREGNTQSFSDFIQGLS